MHYNSPRLPFVALSASRVERATKKVSASRKADVVIATPYIASHAISINIVIVIVVDVVSSINNMAVVAVAVVAVIIILIIIITLT